MTRTLLWTELTNLRRDRIALLLTFVLPIVFFTILSMVFARGGGMTEGVRIAVVDEDRTEASARLIESLKTDSGLRVRTKADAAAADGSGGAAQPAELPLTREQALDLVRRGKLPVAVVIPKGFEGSYLSFEEDSPAIELHADTSDPVAPQMVAGLLQKAAMVGAPDLMAKRGLDMFDQYGGGLTEQQRTLMDMWLPKLREQAVKPASGAASSGETAVNRESATAGADEPAFTGLVNVRTIDVLAQDTDKVAAIAFTAAGTGVLFLLFSMAGSAGTLLEDQQRGVLDRLLSSNVSIGRLMMSKWAFITIVGIVQLFVMFFWGWLVFDIDLFTPRHFTGFAMMTVVTAASAAALGMVLATACRSHAQLSGISTIVILTMSAVGGSMVPRFMMSDTMKTVGLGTFNGWALDGYQKVFWREATPLQLWPQLAVLAGLCVVFLVVARALARRWETV